MFVWSLATALTALARGYPLYLVSRMLVGVGEAAYGSISPSLIADFFPPHKRTQAMSIFYMCDRLAHHVVVSCVVCLSAVLKMSLVICTQGHSSWVGNWFRPRRHLVRLALFFFCLFSHLLIYIY